MLFRNHQNNIETLKLKSAHISTRLSEVGTIQLKVNKHGFSDFDWIDVTQDEISNLIGILNNQLENQKKFKDNNGNFKLIK